MNKLKTTVIVSDPGIDDIIGLFLYNKLSETNSINQLVTSFGNVPEKLTFLNAKEILGFFGKNWSLIKGAALPYNGILERPWPYYFHGPDGVWNVHSNINTSEVICKEQIKKPSTIISLSPLTDLYKIAIKYPDILEVTIMGGVFFEEGNETLYAETNLAFDPDAAALFFKKDWSFKINIIPLDVTRKIHWSIRDVQAIPENKIENKWMKNILLTWFEKYNHEREESFNLHDPLSIYLHFFPKKSEWIKYPVEVITKGKKRGQTVFGTKGVHCNIATKILDPISVKKEIFDLLFDPKN